MQVIDRVNHYGSSQSSSSTAYTSFIARCHSKNLSRGTIAWYGQILKALYAFLNSKGISDFRDVTTAHLREYLGWRRANDLSSETVLRQWGALKCFFRFLYEDQVIPKNPMSRVERPKRERHLIKPFDMVQLQKLLEQPDPQKRSGLEDRAMILLMADSGLRLSEVIGLKMQEIHWDDKIVTVLGKGRKERSVPIGHNSMAALRKYLEVRGPGGQFVFVGLDGKQHTPKCIQNRLRRYGMRAGITGVRVSPHTMRHTFAIQYIRNGGDTFSLQDILGHSSLDMVRNYVNLARRDVSEQHSKFSPMDTLLGRRYSGMQQAFNLPPDVIASEQHDRKSGPTVRHNRSGLVETVESRSC